MRLRRFLLVCGVSIGCAAGGWPADGAWAASRALPYDPETCARDARDMVYFAVGRRVFRQPKDNLTYITLGVPAFRASLPQPPKPEEPEGCPDHPIQGAAFHLSHVSAMPDDPLGAGVQDADRIRLIVNGGDRPNSKNDLFKAICETYSLPVADVPGFSGCKKPFECYMDVTYEAEDYADVDGTPVALFCPVGINCASSPIQCYGGYRLRRDFIVNFRFATGQLPIGKFIEADREVRRRVASSEVKDFQWSPAISERKQGIQK